MNIDFTEIFLALISLIGAIITSVVVPWIKSKTSVQQQDIIKSVVTTAVYAAQQLFGTDEGEKKKEYALQQVSEGLKKYNITLSSDEISTYIEGVLKDIKTNLNDEKDW